MSPVCGIFFIVDKNTQKNYEFDICLSINLVFPTNPDRQSGQYWLLAGHKDNPFHHLPSNLGPEAEAAAGKIYNIIVRKKNC